MRTTALDTRRGSAGVDGAARSAGFSRRPVAHNAPDLEHWATFGQDGFGGLLRLQQTAGNTAVQRLVRLQRDRAGKCGCPRCSGEREGGDGEGVVQRADAGSLDAAVQRSFEEAGSPGNRPNLDVGDKGPGVSLLQRRLKKSGAHIGVDGDFGPLTHDAVVAFQQARTELLPATGGVGPKTWEALDAEELKRSGCHYDPQEKDRSNTSRGSVEKVNEREFLLTDFAPGRSTLKPAHETFLGRLFDDLGLNNPFTDDVVNTTGSTDCVSEDTVADTRLRFARARSVVAFMFTRGDVDGRTSAAQDPFAIRTSGNETAAGRAQNRNVRITVAKRGREDPPRKKKGPDPPGLRPVPPIQTFRIRTTGGGSGGPSFFNGDILHLRVIDVDQGLEADYDYGGFGGGKSLIPIGIALAGKFRPVKVDHSALAAPAKLNDVAGTACLFSSAAFGLLPNTVSLLTVGRGFGTVNLDGVSLSLSLSGSCGVIQMVGDPGVASDTTPDAD